MQQNIFSQMKYICTTVRVHICKTYTMNCVVNSQKISLIMFGEEEGGMGCMRVQAQCNFESVEKY